MNKKEKRSYCRQNGICTICQKAEADKGYATCTKCRENVRNERRKQREYLAKIGLCTECGKKPAFYKHRLCPDCIEKRLQYCSEYAPIYRQNNKDKYRATNRKRYHKLKSMGICTKCGQRQAAKNRTLCVECLAKEKRRPTRSKNGLPREQWGEYNLCAICGKEKRIEGKKICSRCMSTNTIMQARRYIKDHPWLKDNEIMIKKAAGK